jgi:hypothetical protein
MTQTPQPVVSERQHHAISVAAVTLISFIGLEGLAAMNNLYQPAQYVYLAIAVYAFQLLWLVFIFDLHFRDRGTPIGDAESFLHALHVRFRHLYTWKNIRHLYNAAMLPGIIYWATVLLVGINFGHVELQQVLVVTSSVSLVVCYTLFKEIFRTKQLPVSNARFLLLYYAKLYAAWLAYAAALGVVWYYCFPAAAFYTLAFAVTFTLKYQALYQYNSLGFRNVALAAAVALAMCAVSYFVFAYWNVNYFSAGLLMAAVYNLMWGMLFHSVNQRFTRDNIFENLIIFVIMVVIVFGTTNFAERIARC